MSERMTSIETFAREELGIELLPWQKAVAEAYESGRADIFPLGRKAGRETMCRILGEWEAAQAAISSADSAPDPNI